MGDSFEKSKIQNSRFKIQNKGLQQNQLKEYPVESLKETRRKGNAVF